MQLSHFFVTDPVIAYDLIGTSEIKTNTVLPRLFRDTSFPSVCSALDY